MHGWAFRSIIRAMDAELSIPRQGNDHDEGRVVRMLRRFMLAILVFAMTGTFIDLMMFRHYQDPWQLIPLGLLGLLALTLVWHGIRGSAISLRAFQIVMLLLVAGGITGVILHTQASAAYRLELDPQATWWQLASFVLHSKVPPTLAPGGLMQMGLIGLAYTYRHPALHRRTDR